MEDGLAFCIFLLGKVFAMSLASAYKIRTNGVVSAL